MSEEKERKLLLVYGYIRNEQKRLDLNIPKEIQQLIYLYNKFGDVWNKQLINNDVIEMNEFYNSIKAKEDGVYTLLLNVVYLHGS